MATSMAASAATAGGTRLGLASQRLSVRSLPWRPVNLGGPATERRPRRNRSPAARGPLSARGSLCFPVRPHWSRTAPWAHVTSTPLRSSSSWVAGRGDDGKANAGPGANDTAAVVVGEGEGEGAGEAADDDDPDAGTEVWGREHLAQAKASPKTTNANAIFWEAPPPDPSTDTVTDTDGAAQAAGAESGVGLAAVVGDSGGTGDASGPTLPIKGDWNWGPDSARQARYDYWTKVVTSSKSRTKNSKVGWSVGPLVV